jgi:general secretion pathway protein G
MRRARKNQGFTLIELLLVIVIIATLAAIVVPNLAGSSEKGKIGAAKGQIAGFELALDKFEAECGRYPTTAEGLNALQVAPAGLKGWAGPYLKKDVPMDPWDHPYNYKSPGTHSTAAASYDLWSNGPDGQDGTDDDIQSWNINKKDTKQ